MAEDHRSDRFGCGCGGGCSRREFLSTTSLAAGVVAVTPKGVRADEGEKTRHAEKQGAKVRAIFLYPPSKSFASNPDGWWSWPGNDFDAEGRQKKYVEAFGKMEKKLGMTIAVDERPVANKNDAKRVAAEVEAEKPDGLLLVMFYNRSLKDADLLLAAAEKAGLPAVFYIGLGVKHGTVDRYRRPGIYFIQSLDNLEAIEYGMRMINSRKILRQSRLLSITEAKEPREGVENFLGVTVRVTPFAKYAERFKQVAIDDEAKKLIAQFKGGAKELRGVNKESLENAARAHFALRQLLKEHNADGLTMNCLRRGMLKPCMSFATLNSQLIPAACENDLRAAHTQLLGQLLTGRPGFQHNPAFDTERNHYYASHCTCPSKVYGPNGAELSYLLRRFAHTNEGSCAIQVFYKPDDPVTIVRYHPGKEPALDVYAGKIVKSHAMPPVGGCTTNAEVEITDRPDACMVRGHHNLLFCGDFARKFRLFAHLFKMKLAETNYRGPWPL
jgi:hypothetical protein